MTDSLSVLLGCLGLQISRCVKISDIYIAAIGLALVTLSLSNTEHTFQQQKHPQETSGFVFQWNSKTIGLLARKRGNLSMFMVLSELNH